MTQARISQGSDRRQRMIVETECFLRRYLPCDRARSQQQQLQVNHPGTSPVDRSNRPSRNGNGARRSWSSSPLGAWIEPAVSECGDLDDDQLRVLTMRLYESARYSPGDILIDLTTVRTVTQSFHRVMQALERYLEEQNRHLLVLEPCRPLNGRHTGSPKTWLV